MSKIITGVISITDTTNNSVSKTNVFRVENSVFFDKLPQIISLYEKAGFKLQSSRFSLLIVLVDKALNARSLKSFGLTRSFLGTLSLSNMTKAIPEFPLRLTFSKLATSV